MNLQVGKAYLNRQGDRVEIVAELDIRRTFYPFIGIIFHDGKQKPQDYCFYESSGSADYDFNPEMSPIISEIPEPKGSLIPQCLGVTTAEDGTIVVKSVPPKPCRWYAYMVTQWSGFPMDDGHKIAYFNNPNLKNKIRIPEMDIE